MSISIGSLFGSLMFVTMLLKLLCSVFVDSSISSKLVLIGGGRFEDWVVVALVESEVVRMLD